MPKTRQSRSKDTEEPPRKMKRIVQQQPTPIERTVKARKCKKVAEKAQLNICDLPTEILEKIIGYINIWHHNRIRGTCRRLKEVNDVFVMHEFQKAWAKHMRQYSTSEAAAALRVIKYATEVYVQSGFESTFCGCILPMLRSCYKDPFSPHFSQIKKFLVHFYGIIAELMGDICSQRWRLLYSITLIKLIKIFNKSTVSSNVMPLHCRIAVELKGPWLGTLWTVKGRHINQSRYRYNLLVILSDLLVSNISGKDVKHVWECPSEMYVFGNDTSNSYNVPMTLFTFNIYGSKKICNLFLSCLEQDPEQFQWPCKWPNDQFTVNLDIICKKAMRWGCSKSQHMEFGPFAEVYSPETDEETDC